MFKARTTPKTHVVNVVYANLPVEQEGFEIVLDAWMKFV